MTQRRESPPGEVCLLDAFPQLTAEMEAREMDRARGELMVRVERVRPGTWRPPASAGAGNMDLGLFIVGGLLARHVVVADTKATELIGRGDLLRPVEHQGEEAPVPFRAEWTVLEPLAIAVLDAEITRAVCRWPQLVTAIVSAAVRRSFSLADHLALSHLRRVDDRLMVMFWHFADRWGSVRREGVLVPLKLTHEMLGEVIGAQRPSVTTALGQLEAAGRISRRREGGWLLHGDPPQRLSTTPQAAAD
jgi:CRP/FNR family transcriptional regulator, cyclic AMP receptor protein